MSRTKELVSLLGGVAVVVLAGCHGDYRTATQQNMARMDREQAAPRDYLVNQVDNAILHDMSLADFHFIPHSKELSGSGVARLDRMALMLDTYGGTVRYETALTDEALIKGRLDNVKEYLTLVGVSMEKVALTTALSGGRGGAVRDAIAAQDKAKEQPTVLSQQTGFTAGGGK